MTQSCPFQYVLCQNQFVLNKFSYTLSRILFHNAQQLLAFNQLQIFNVLSVLKPIQYYTFLNTFVQSDWFLPVFISHDIDTAGGAFRMFHTDNASDVLAPD